MSAKHTKDFMNNVQLPMFKLQTYIVLIHRSNSNLKVGYYFCFSNRVEIQPLLKFNYFDEWGQWTNSTIIRLDMHIVSYKKSKNTRVFDLQYINSSIFTSVKYRLTFLVSIQIYNALNTIYLHMLHLKRFHLISLMWI